MAGKEETETGAQAKAGAASGAPPTLGVGMVGYAFMGAAHSQGWRTAGRVFDLPARPVLAAVCGRDVKAVRAAADQHGWAAAETDWRALIARVRRADRRHLHPGRQPRGDRRRRSGGGQARAVREAAGQLGRRGGDHDGRRRRGPGPWPGGDGRLQLPPGARHDVRPPDDRGGQARGAAARARHLPPGLARRPGVPADLEAPAAARGFGRARRPGRAHRGPRAVPGGGAAGGRVRADRDLRTVQAAARRGHGGALGGRGRRGTARRR